MTGREHISPRTKRDWDPEWSRFDDRCTALRQTRLSSVKTLQTMPRRRTKRLQPVFGVG
ncbi:hypothetical protein Rcae01_06707 [Novipirellula caenicola]|uniref:Uncharacterized protein n=1 Tax=Novipirellula caenicola TaxID=1536901 RepID=A0ABP9W2G4_9BACT